MERKFLESLGIEKEAIDKIMAENGKDIEAQKALTAAEGNNTLVVTAKDAAGLTTPVTINFKIDTSVPKIKSVRITPNPAAASSSIEIELEIE